MTEATLSKRCVHIGILLTHEFSMLSFSSLIAPMRLANQLSGKTLYRWSTISTCATPVTAGNGISVSPDCVLTPPGDIDAVIVCGGDQLPLRRTLSHLDILNALPEGTIIGASCSGTYLLARANLLAGYQCTIHWEHIAATRERFPDLNLTPTLFEIDRDRYTCAGGKAALDMMLHAIGAAHGQSLSAAITEHLVCDRQRDAKDGQILLFNKSLYRTEPKLAEAVSLMEANLEEPITLADLSEYTGLSNRQLERLFKKHMRCVPSRFYMKLRLEKARQLLLKTAKPVSDIASECGFVSSPHFSKSYRDAFGLPPRQDRIQIREPKVPAIRDSRC